MEIYADTAEGYINIETSGGNGKNGQNGKNGIAGAARTSQVQRSITCSKSIQPIYCISYGNYSSNGDDDVDDDGDHHDTNNNDHIIIICFRSPLPGLSGFIICQHY